MEAGYTLNNTTRNLPTSGIDNTGSGGGGAVVARSTNTNYDYTKGAGGSGVLYLYIDNSYIYRFSNITGGYSMSNATYGGTTYNVMTFTGGGTFTPSIDITIKYMLIVGGGGSGGNIWWRWWWNSRYL